MSDDGCGNLPNDNLTRLINTAVTFQIYILEMSLSNLGSVKFYPDQVVSSQPFTPKIVQILVYVLPYHSMLHSPSY